MTIHRILMGDKWNEKKAVGRFAGTAVIFFLLISARPMTAVGAQEVSPSPASEKEIVPALGEKENSPTPTPEETTLPSGELAEVEQRYGSITWQDVLSSGPNHLGYSVLVDEKPREYSGMKHSEIRKQEGRTLVYVAPASNK